MLVRNTILGVVKIKGCMVDIDGRNLEEGVDIFLDDHLILSLYGKYESDFEEMNEYELEKFLIKETPL